MAIKSFKRFPIEGTCFQLYPSKIMLKVFNFSLLTHVKFTCIYTIRVSLKWGQCCPPRRHVAMCRDILVVTAEECCWHCAGRGEGAHKYLAMHRNSPHCKKLPSPTHPYAEVRKLWSIQSTVCRCRFTDNPYLRISKIAPSFPMQSQREIGGLGSQKTIMSLQPNFWRIHIVVGQKPKRRQPCPARLLGG